MGPEDRAAAAAAGMLAGEGNVHVWRPRGTPSFEALLARMHSCRRGSILRERRIVAASGLDDPAPSTARDLDAAWAERFFVLYTRTYERHSSVPWLNADYFRRLFSDLGDVVELLAAFDGDTCVAAVLCMRSPGTLHVLHWGQSGDRPFLHFELVFYRTMERAIELGVDALDYGAGGRHKAPRGIGLEAVHHAAWFRAPAFVETATLALAQRSAAAAAERAAETARLPFDTAGSRSDSHRAIPHEPARCDRRCCRRRCSRSAAMAPAAASSSALTTVATCFTLARSPRCSAPNCAVSACD